jgi:hypothetical protein
MGKRKLVRENAALDSDIYPLSQILRFEGKRLYAHPLVEIRKVERVEHRAGEVSHLPGLASVLGRRRVEIQ